MEIIDIWEENLDEVKLKLNDIIKNYDYVAMDTEFPGIVTHPVLKPGEISDFPYKILKSNVDLLKVIQIGFSFSTSGGSTPRKNGCWQFNFFFDLEEDLFAQDSIDLLLRSGVNFQAHKKKGIRLEEFAKFLITSGLVLNKKIKWISFHSGYDFGYLIKILTNKDLPGNRDEFLNLLNIYFPCVFDVKYLSNFLKGFNGGLDKLAEKLEIKRFGKVHQAGSDSLLTSEIFFRLKTSFSQISFKKKFGGILYGLGVSMEKADLTTEKFFEERGTERLTKLLLEVNSIG